MRNKNNGIRHALPRREGRLSGKVALVIGASGDIGGAIAQAYCREGAIVVPTGRNRSRVEAIVRKLAVLRNPWQRVVTTNVDRPADVSRIARLLCATYGRIDILACVAGIYLNTPAETMTLTEWNRVLQTNLTGTFTACQSIGRTMLAHGSGSIITIGSLGSFVALSNTAAYSVSKAGVVALTRSLATEWAPRGVRVNALIPGVFPTRLNAKALAMKGRLKNILRGIPMKRLGALDELSSAAVYLASDESRYVTGSALPVDGGFLASSGF